MITSTLFSSEPCTEKLMNLPSFPEILWVILIESQKLQKLMRNCDHPFPIFHQWKNGGHHLACWFIQENVLGVLELGREGGREGKLKLGVGLELGGGGRGAAQGSTTWVSLFSLAKLSLPSNRSFPALCYSTRLNIIMNVASKYNTAISCKYYFPWTVPIRHYG